MGKLKFTVSTDEKQVIKLESKLLSHEWKRSLAYAGQSIDFVIETVFVGHKQDIVIRGYSEKKGLFDTLEDGIQYDHYEGALSVPEDMEQGDSIYFEVKLPKLGLVGYSGYIPVKTMPWVKNLKWSQEEAKRDDILTLCADAYNIDEHTKATVKIYEYDPNGAHDKMVHIHTTVKNKKVEIMWKYIYHGDRYKIVTKKECETYGAQYQAPSYFFTITIGTTEYGLDLSSKLLKLAVEYENTADVLEFEDALFRLESAVMMPDRLEDEQLEGKANFKQQRITGLQVITTLLLFAFKHPEQALLITGHTDRSGSDSYNFGLSRDRAKSALYLIEKREDEWAALSDSRHKPEDIQHILQWLGYNPGPIDGDIGSQTTEKIKKFQSNSNLKSDGVVGKKTWAVIFGEYQKALDEMMEHEENGSGALKKRGQINWAYGGDQKAVGCGPNFPISTIAISENNQPGKINEEWRCQADRRLEALFFDPKELKEAGNNCAVSGICSKDTCKIYEDRLFGRHYIPSIPRRDFYLRLNMSYETAGRRNTLFILTSKDGKYSETKTLKDDRVAGDDYVDLVFRGLLDDGIYSLEIDPGNGGTLHYLFENVVYTEFNALSPDDPI